MATIRYIKGKDEEIVLPVTHERGVIDSNGVTLETKLGQKQATLVSGTNIKTINNQSLLGSGNISISGGDPPENCEVTTNKVTAISGTNTDTQYPSAKAVYDYVEGLESIIGDIDSVMENINDDSSGGESEEDDEENNGEGE